MAGKFYLFSTKVLELQCACGAYMVITSACGNYDIWTYYKGHSTLNHCKHGELTKKVQWIKDNMSGKHGLILNGF